MKFFVASIDQVIQIAYEIVLAQDRDNRKNETYL